MDYDNFKKMIIEEFPRELSNKTGKEYNVESCTISKRNCQKAAFVCREDGVKMAPILCIDDMYKDFCDFGDFKKVIDVWVNTYISSMNTDMEKRFRATLKPDYIFSNVYPYIVNAALNEDMLKDVLHVRWNDLAVIFKVHICEGTSYTLTHTNAETLNLKDLKDVYEHAKKNVFNKHKLNAIKDELNAMKDELGPAVFMDDNNCLHDIPVTVLTTEYDFGGAGIVVCLGESINFSENCYLLPSSVNEFLVVRDEEFIDVDILHMMVYEVNREGLAYNEFLSDNVYYYNAQTQEITMLESPYGKVSPFEKSRPVL